jgi:hypothetical protein
MIVELGREHWCGLWRRGVSSFSVVYMKQIKSECMLDVNLNGTRHFADRVNGRPEKSGANSRPGKY